MENLYSTAPRKSKPAVLLIFDRGFDALPVVVPNGGDEQIDDQLMEWCRQNLIAQTHPRKAAA